MAKEQVKKLGQVTLKGARASFFKAFEKTASVASGREGYRSNWLFDPNTAEGRACIAACKKAVEEVKVAQWKDKAKSIKFKPDRLCFREGDTFCNEETGEIYEGYEGMMALVTNNQNKPTIVNRDRTPLSKDDGVIYSGCYCVVVARFYAVTGQEKGGNGIFCTLEGVQFLRNGEAFGSAALNAEEAFEDLGDLEDDGDALDDDDDENGMI